MAPPVTGEVVYVGRQKLMRTVTGFPASTS
jgi:hypothetical protein